MQETCNNTQDVQIAASSYVVNGQITCEGGVYIGNNSVIALQSCDQQAQVSVLSKIIADQTATSNAKSGIALGLDAAYANATNFVDVTNNISAFLAANCMNNQKVSIGVRNYRIDATINSKGACYIGDNTVSQTAACVQNLIGDFVNDSESSQIASSTASAGFDLAEVLKYLMYLCLAVCLLMLMYIILKASLKTSSKTSSSSSSMAPSGLFGSGGPSISFLQQKLKILQSTRKT